MIAIYILANILFLLVVIKKKIYITDIFVYVYLGFINLYTLSIYISSITDIYMLYPIIQLRDRRIVSIVLFTSSIALLTFSICLFFSKQIKESEYYINIKNICIFKWIYIVFFPIAFYLNTIDNWTSGTRIGIVAQLSAYSRNILTVLLIVIFTSKKVKNWKKTLFLASFMVITFKSTQRTNAMIVLIAFAYNLKSSKKVMNILMLGIVALLSLGAIRNGMNMFNFVYSILAEGLFGSWGLLQAIEITNIEGYSWTSFFKLFGSTLNWFFSQFGLITSIPTLEQIVLDTRVSYYPMGGFFYLSDAYLMHPFFGPIIYTILIFLLYKWSLKEFYGKHDPKYLICLSILFCSVKGALWTFTALLLFHQLFYIVLNWITNTKHMVKVYK